MEAPVRPAADDSLWIQIGEILIGVAAGFKLYLLRDVVGALQSHGNFPSTLPVYFATGAKRKLKWYEEQLRMAQHKRFGASNEKSDPNQMELPLFNEAEVTAVLVPASEEERTCACCGYTVYMST